MKRFLLSTSGLVLTASAAYAADLDAGVTYNEPAVVHSAPADQGWDGFVIGVHGGYGWANRNGCSSVGIFVPPESCQDKIGEFNFDYDQEGWLAGAQAGYNHAFSSNFIAGIEVDGSLTDISGSTDSDDEVDPGSGTWQYLASVTGKLGWTPGRFMIYAEGGYAIGAFDFNGSTGCNFTSNHTGPVAGGGIAMKVTNNVSTFVEYNHIWMDKDTNACATSGFPTFVETDAEIDLVKFGVNYHFKP